MAVTETADAMASAAPRDAVSIHSAPGWSGNIREFHERDLHYWRSGRWVRTVHEGRGGWWWVIDDVWYPYAQVTYPHPDPYTPSPYKQPDVLGQIVAEHTLSHTFYWYYCDGANEYYPYVVSCERGCLFDCCCGCCGDADEDKCQLD